MLRFFIFKKEVFIHLMLVGVFLLNTIIPTNVSAMNSKENSLESNGISFQDNFQSDLQAGFSQLNESYIFNINSFFLLNEKQRRPSFDTSLTNVKNLPTVQFEFLASPTQATPGDEVLFNIVITNNSKSEISGLFFSNSLPNQIFNPKSEEAELIFNPENNTLIFNGKDTTILPGEVFTLNYTAIVRPEISENIQIIDEADLFIENPKSSYVASLHLGVFLQDEKKEFTLIGSENGQASGLEGQVLINIPAGELSVNEGILVEDLTEKFKSDESAPLIVFQLDVASRAEVPQEIRNDNPTLETSTITPTTIPTITPEILIPEPSLTFEDNLTSSATPEISATESLPSPTDIEENSSSVDMFEPDTDEAEETLEATVTSTETPTLTPTETIIPTETPTIVISPTPTVSQIERATPTTIVNDELPSTPQEQDAVALLEVKESEFDNPVEITVSFDGLADFSTMGAEYQPYVVTLDESSGVWINVPIASTDIENNTVTVETNHFSTWGAGLGTFVPQNGANIPMFDTAYPDLFTGGAHYSIPIWTPPGRHGMQPNLSLSYSSRTVDGVLGDVQAPWVGMGWNIDTVEILREINNISTCPTRSGVKADFCKDNVLSYGYRNKFTLIFNGSSSELIVDATTPGRYHTKSESFLYIQLHNANIGNSPSLNNTSGEWWEIVERDGTRWRLGWNEDSEQLAAMKGYPGVATGSWGVLGYAGEEQNVVAKRWRADLVYDVFGNAMTFTYHEDSRAVNGVAQNYDYASYLEIIYYTQYTSDQNINDGITIDISPSAGYSIVFERETRTGDNGPIPADLKDWDNWDEERLKKIKVMYGVTPIRVYTLSYSVPIYNSLYSTTVLDSIQITDGTEVLSAPIIEFEYVWKNNISSASPYPYPRMESITNGYGGEITYTYSNDGRTLSWYNWRVTSLTIDDGGITTPAVTTFTYGTPCYKHDFNPSDVCGATTATTYRGELIGYLSTTITHPNVDGSQLKEVHTFNTLTGTTAYQKWGREAKISYFNGSTELYRVENTYTVSTSGLPAGAFFTYPSQVITRIRNGTSLTQVNKATYTYDTATGNVLSQTDYKGTSTTVYRGTNYSYQVNTNPSVWILDKLWKQTLTSGSVISEVQFGYDGNLPNQGTITKGELTLSRLVNGTQTVDTGYVYDVYGNVIETQVYQQYGSTSSLPSGTPLTYTTLYDNTLFIYPIAFANPQFPASPELASYDFALGLPISKTDANGNTTTTDYDALGRIEAITYPSYAQPNMQYIYPTGVSISAPARIETQILDDTISGYRSVYQFYDGLGRLVETQTPYNGSATFTFTEYNAIGKVKSQSQPQQVTVAVGTYQLPTTAQKTIFAYEVLGRPKTVTYPDLTTESFSYSYLTASHIDQNNHKTDQVKDEFGRLITVKEYTGSGTYTLYATTTYAYDVRDLLTTVTDAQSNVTTITYDGFGRKTGMTDPNMGTWGYEYYPNGNLHIQTDARNCTVTMAYDNINRPVSKQYGGTGACSGNPTVTYGYDSTTGGNEGIGHRTSMSDGSGSTSWFYNALGQMTNETRTIDGNNYASTFTYDAFGRPLTQGLPGNASETLNFNYNAMGALVSLSGTNTYVSNITYDESGQVTNQTLGNGLKQQFCYQDSNQRVISARTYSGMLKPCILLDVPNSRLNFSYSYQNNGNISQLVDWVKDEAINYTYDDIDRLTNASGPYNQTFTYSTTGNILTKSNPSSMTAVSTGGNHTCSLTSGGGVMCWGSDQYGQLGDNSSLTTQYSPVNVSTLTTGVQAISAGLEHTCALISNGTVKCWGRNHQGQLGDNTIVNKPTPITVLGSLSNVLAISTGYYHTCALISGGTVKCWGDNANGQLGDGSTTDRRLPTSVSGLSNVIAISTYGVHTCALINTGEVKCWGSNFYGQLGDGTTTQRTIPTSVISLNGTVTSISTGQSFTCALMSNGSVKCWGHNGAGQLGDGTNVNQTTPVDVSGLTSGVITISSGKATTCALTDINTVKCWGDNNNLPTVVDGLTNIASIDLGEVGVCAIQNGSVKCRGHISILGIGNMPISKTTPSNVSGLENGVVTLSRDGTYLAMGNTCALTENQSVLCWGRNHFGQLGDGTYIDRSTPVEVIGVEDAIAISTGLFGNSCILTSAHGVKCWGRNDKGQLGNGTTINSNIPVDVVGLTSGVSSISVGARHACAVLNTAEVKCWGANYARQLGDGTNIDRDTPVLVSGLTNVASIVTHDSHTCAILMTGALKCWGDNNKGQLGDGTTFARSTPVNVTSMTSGVTSVVLSEYHTCAIQSGVAKCWGSNLFGEVGDGTLTARTAPVSVTGLTNAIAISVSLYSTCAITNSHGLKCWGRNGYGQLGNNATTDSKVPVNVIGLTNNVDSVYMSKYNDTTCAITTSRAVKCWGDSTYGQIGDGTSAYRLYPVNVIFPTTATTTYTYADTAHKQAVTSLSTGETYTYDANGNMITRVENGQTYTQTYNAENRLASVTVNSETTQFIYDGDGNLVKQINPDGSKLIMIGEMYQEVRDASNALTDWTVYYPAGGAMRVNGTLYYLLKDHLGSASVLTDSSGNIVDEQRYMPFGEPRLAGDDILTDRLFTGQRDVPSIDLMDYNARMYSPALGRFIQPDTIVPDMFNPQSLNRYSYVLNNPIRYTDPTGHCYAVGGNSIWIPDGNDGPCNWLKNDTPKPQGDITLHGIPDAVAITLTPEELKSIADQMNEDLYTPNIGLLDQVQSDANNTTIGFTIGFNTGAILFCAAQLIVCGVGTGALVLGTDVSFALIVNQFADAKVQDLRNTEEYFSTAVDIANANNLQEVSIQIYTTVEDIGPYILIKGQQPVIISAGPYYYNNVISPYIQP